MLRACVKKTDRKSRACCLKCKSATDVTSNRISVFVPGWPDGLPKLRKDCGRGFLRETYEVAFGAKDIASAGRVL
jgi:hypothetical protein